MTWAYHAGVSGTVSNVNECKSVACHCTSAGSLQINGGDVIPIPAGASFDTASEQMGKCTFVFTNTDSYFVEYET